MQFEAILGLGYEDKEFDFVRILKSEGVIENAIFGIGIRDSEDDSCSSDIKFGTYSAVNGNALVWHAVATTGKWDVLPRPWFHT